MAYSRIWILLVGLSGAGMVPACKAPVTVSDVVVLDKKQVTGRGHLAVTNLYGEVFVRGTRGLPTTLSGRLVRKARARGRKRAKEFLSALKIATNYKSDPWTIRVEGPKERSKVRADLDLDVPVDSDLTVNGRRGRVRVFGIHGRVSVDVDQGHVELRGMAGPVSVTVRHLGDVVVSGELQAAQVDVGKGAVRVRWLRGEPKQDCSVKTKEGDIRLVIHKAWNGKVLVISPNPPEPADLFHEENGTYQASFGSGGPEVRLEAPKGKVTLLRLGVVPFRPIPQKGFPSIRGGSPIKAPKTLGPAVTMPKLPTRSGAGAHGTARKAPASRATKSK